MSQPTLFDEELDQQPEDYITDVFFNTIYSCPNCSRLWRYLHNNPRCPECDRIGVEIA